MKKAENMSPAFAFSEAGRRHADRHGKCVAAGKNKQMALTFILSLLPYKKAKTSISRHEAGSGVEAFSSPAQYVPTLPSLSNSLGKVTAGTVGDFLKTGQMPI